MADLSSLRSHSLEILWNRLALAQLWERRPSLLFSLCAFTLVASLTLGGGTRGGFLSDAILQLIAIPALVISLSSLFAWPWTESKGRAEWALALCVAIAFLPLIELVPLPPAVWTKLPQREHMTAIFEMLGRDAPWLPMSVAPSATWLSVLSLLPPLAIFLSVIQLNYRERRLLSLIFIGVGIVSAFLGLLQVAQGPLSSLRFFAITNESEAVGFFANRNHLAALLYVVLVFGAAWATDVAFAAGAWKDRNRLLAAPIVALTASFLVLVILIAAESITRSRAGLALTIAAVAGAFALAATDRRQSSGLTPVRLLVGSALAAFMLITQFALYRMLDRFATDPLEDARVAFARNTITAAKAYMPFGSGAGTFVSVYPMFERSEDAIANVYANHAHNDVLEMWLEGGVAGVILMTAFVIWFAFRSVSAWRRAPSNVRPIDRLLARAATMAIPLIVAHSFVDYPLRTGGIMAVFALACALLVEPVLPVPEPTTVEPGGADGERERRPVRLPGPPPSPAKDADLAPKKPPRRPPQPWGEDIEWPEQWRK